VPGVVAPARAITVTRRADDHDAETSRPGREWDESPRQRRAPAVVPTADSRTTPSGLSPGPLLLLAGGLLAVALGFIGLAGAWPGLASQLVRGWWRRALLAGAGVLWLAIAALSTPRNFYFPLAHVTPATLEPVGLATLSWALGAALGPLLARTASDGFNLALLSAVAAAMAVALTLLGPHHIVGLVPGALVGWLIAAHRPLIGVIRHAMTARALP
jgi:hypothetical protein